MRVLYFKHNSVSFINETNFLSTFIVYHYDQNNPLCCYNSKLTTVGPMLSSSIR